MQWKMKMGTHRGLLAFAVLAVLMLAGCNGNREAALAGTWKIDASALKIPEPKGGNAQQQAGIAMAKQMMANASIEIKADKTFAMSMGVPMEGTWAFDDAASTVSLTMTKMMGMDIAKMPNMNQSAREPLLCQLSADGKQLSVQPKAGQPNPAGSAMTFIKQ